MTEHPRVPRLDDASDLWNWRCPSCGSEDAVPITYGLITVFKDDGSVVGGCLLSDDSPTNHCRDCATDIGAVGSVG